MERPTRVVSMDLLTGMLQHLHSVTLGHSFYLNAISLGKPSIQNCCECFWHGASTDHYSDNDLDLMRVRSMISLVRLIDSLDNRSGDEQHSLLSNIREKLRFISPFVNSGKNVASRTTRHNTAECEFLLMDQRMMVLTIMATLLKLCQIIEPMFKTSPLIQPIINDVHEYFVRPYSLILWSRAKRELVAK